jgi:hypothetical protein
VPVTAGLLLEAYVKALREVDMRAIAASLV